MLHSNVCQPMTQWYSLMWSPLWMNFSNISLKASKLLKDQKCWNIQKENEFLKDSVWAIQCTVWGQSQIVEHQPRTGDQANKKDEKPDGFRIQFWTIHSKRKGCFNYFESSSNCSSLKMDGRSIHFPKTVDFLISGPFTFASPLWSTILKFESIGQPS